MYIDSHAHVTSEQIDDVEGLLQRAKTEKVDAIINICTDVLTLEKGLELVKKYPWVHNAAATTPHDVEKEGASFFPIVRTAALNKQLVAIGETGLDYYYEHSPKEMQKEFLIRYFALAKEVDLPVIIHCRDAFDDLFKIADVHYSSKPLLLHCFTGTTDEALRALERGWYISFSGIVTYKKSEALRETLKIVPIEKVLIETDTPYLAPQSKRGKPNEPAYIAETLSTVASVKNLEISEAAAITAKNARTLFKI